MTRKRSLVITAALCVFALFATLTPVSATAGGDNTISGDSTIETDSDTLTAVREAPESFATVPLTDCPWITDSIVRLYSAYLLRPPDAEGFGYWLGFYENGTGLEAISENFALSAEFVNTYGALSSGDFVNLVYTNVLGRAPDEAGFNYWKGLLDSGQITYGGTMLSFSESAEFVRKSGTVRPAAGYLLWFAPGTQFFCGVGTADITVPFANGSLGYVMLPPADGRDWGHDFDVYQPGGATVFKNNPFDPSIPNTATVLTADFENLTGYVLRLTVEPDIRWSLNLATGGQPDNLDTWLGDPSVPRS